MRGLAPQPTLPLPDARTAVDRSQAERTNARPALRHIDTVAYTPCVVESAESAFPLVRRKAPPAVAIEERCVSMGEREGAGDLEA